jgi:hypothetical protein
MGNRVKFFVMALSLTSLCANAVIHQKVLICGVCRDVEPRLPKTMQIMEQIGALFDDYKILVYENNSQDATAGLLHDWARNNNKVVVKSETVDDAELDKVVVNRKDDQQFFRPELISRARNIVLDMAMSEAYKEFTHIIWMDMDFVIPPDFDGMVEAFESNREWDAVFAYGVDPSETYWDWYAFRDATLPIGSELLGNKWWYMPKHFSLARSDDWHPVYSAFGGCGIYKKSSIEGCRYSAIVNENLEYSAREIIREGKATGHPQVLDYLSLNEGTSLEARIDSAHSQLPRIEDPNIGIILNSRPDPLVWRMSSFVDQYPSTCEHVPFHACMIRRGHGKLFINPRLKFRYGG